MRISRLLCEVAHELPEMRLLLDRQVAAHRLAVLVVDPVAAHRLGRLRERGKRALHRARERLRHVDAELVQPWLARTWPWLEEKLAATRHGLRLSPRGAQGGGGFAVTSWQELPAQASEWAQFAWSTHRARTLAGGVAVAVMLFAMLACCCSCCRSRSRHGKYRLYDPLTSELRVLTAELRDLESGDDEELNQQTRGRRRA